MGARTWKVMKKVVLQDLTEPMKMVTMCGIWFIRIDVQVWTKLSMWKYLRVYVKLCV
jgi:hypothetical protein